MLRWGFVISLYWQEVLVCCNLILYLVDGVVEIVSLVRDLFHFNLKLLFLLIFLYGFFLGDIDCVLTKFFLLLQIHYKFVCSFNDFIVLFNLSTIRFDFVKLSLLNIGHEVIKTFDFYIKVDYFIFFN